MAASPSTIFIADRNLMSSQLLAESLERDPRFEVAAIAPASNLLAHSALSRAVVAVISAELDSGPRKGMHLARSLRARAPELSIVILLESLERDEVIASFRSGAKGVFCRTEPLSELRSCIDWVSQGRIWAGRLEAECLLDAIQSAPNVDGMGELSRLTRRESTVAELAVQGLSNRQIAQQLGLSEHTVKNYLFRIFDKLKVANRIELLFLMVKGRNCQYDELPLRLFFEEKPSEPAVVAAAEDGLLSAQFMLGLAHLEGKGVENDYRTAYYWLRMAELNSSHVLQQSRCGIEKLKSRLPAADIRDLEQQISHKAQENQRLNAKGAAEGIPAQQYLLKRA